MTRARADSGPLLHVLEDALEDRLPALVVTTFIVASILPLTTGILGSGVRVALAVGAPAYDPGEPVTFAIVVRNVGFVDARVDFATSCHTRFEVLDVRSGIVYHSEVHYGCFEMLTSITLAPGETRTYPWTWDQTTDEKIPVRHPSAVFLLAFFGSRPAVAPILLV